MKTKLSKLRETLGPRMIWLMIWLMIFVAGLATIASLTSPRRVLPIVWLQWPTGECVAVSRNGSCQDAPAKAEIGWVLYDGTKPIDIEFEPGRAQRSDPDGYTR